MDRGTETMIERQNCDRHETMIREVAALNVEVSNMKASNERITVTMEKMTDKLSEMERRMIWWAGGISCCSTILVGIVSNLDKIKSLLN